MVSKKSSPIAGALPFVLVLALSLGLLIYVGFGDANRVYPQFFVNEVAALGEVIHTKIENFILSGLPLKQFTGFQQLSAPVLEAEESIIRMEIINNQKDILFFAPEDRGQVNPAGFKYGPSKLSLQGEHTEVFENESYYKITFPLNNKFETVGYLNIYCPVKAVKETINNSFAFIWVLFGGLLVFFGILVTVLFRLFKEKSKLPIQIGYMISFITLAAFILVTLISLYFTGIQGKSQAMAKSLSQRLNVAVELGLDMDDFSGIDAVFESYRKINPDIEYIALVENENILIHTDQKAQNQSFAASSDLIEFQESIGEDIDTGKKLKIGVGVPRDIIYAMLLRSGKNFVILLIASAFLSMLFLNLLISVRQSQTMEEHPDLMQEQKDLQLQLIGPLYFLTLFLEGLFVSFLPQFFQDVAAKSNIDPGFASILFTIYFGAFVASLIPSGRLAEKQGVKKLLIISASLFTISYIILASSQDFYFILLSRILGGFGQGMLFISVQSYILRLVDKKQKTKGTSVIVFGYNGGMISGTAIGALLVNYLGETGVFTLASVIGVLIVAYVIFLIAEVDKPKIQEAETGKETKKPNLLANISTVFKDMEFVKTMLLVGIITKAILTGINKYALPLVLSKMNFLKEDIGQILIFYSAAVLVSTFFLTKRKEKHGSTKNYLLIGSFVGGFGLLLMGMVQFDFLLALGIPNFTTIIILLGIIVLGFAHGFIHAPIVTHISETKVAKTLGVSTTTSLYRFLERIGHVSGPIIVGQVLIAMSYDPFSIGVIGIATIAAGLLFVVLPGQVKGEAK